MSEQTTNLSLPYIMAAQAQKHVTHNEALRALDAVVQISIEDRDLSTPPATPVEGSRYIIGPSASGDWAGQEGKLAAFQDGAWEIYVPVEGWAAWISDESASLVFDGTDWVDTSMITEESLHDGTVAKLGVNAVADDTNRLSVNSDAVLLNNNGANIQVKLNKNSASDTASVLFQTGFSGRAEFGTTGDDDFHVKVSPDGSTFYDSILIDKDNGNLAVGDLSIAPATSSITTDNSVSLPSFAQFNSLAAAYPLNSGSRGSFLAAVTSPIGLHFGGFMVAKGTAVKWTMGISDYSSSPNALHFLLGGLAASPRLSLETDGTLLPGQNAVSDIGSASKQYDNIYLANAPTVSSDRDLKHDIRALNNNEVEVATKLLRMARAYKMRESLGKKGEEKARTHFGWVAQDVASVFEAAGLNPSHYAPYCADDLMETVIVGEEDGQPVYEEQKVIREDGNPSKKLSLRYEPLFTMLVTALAQRLDDLEAKLAAGA